MLQYGFFSGERLAKVFSHYVWPWRSSTTYFIVRSVKIYPTKWLTVVVGDKADHASEVYLVSPINVCILLSVLRRIYTYLP